MGNTPFLTGACGTQRPPIRALGPSKIMRARNATAAIVEQMKLSKAVQRACAQQVAEEKRSAAACSEGDTSGAVKTLVPIALVHQRSGVSSERGSIIRDLEAPRILTDLLSSGTPGTLVQKEDTSKRDKAKSPSSKRKQVANLSWRAQRWMGRGGTYAILCHLERAVPRGPRYGDRLCHV